MPADVIRIHCGRNPRIAFCSLLASERHAFLQIHVRTPPAFATGNSSPLMRTETNLASAGIVFAVVADRKQVWLVFSNGSAYLCFFAASSLYRRRDPLRQRSACLVHDISSEALVARFRKYQERARRAGMLRGNRNCPMHTGLRSHILHFLTENYQFSLEAKNALAHI